MVTVILGKLEMRIGKRDSLEQSVADMWINMQFAGSLPALEGL